MMLRKHPSVPIQRCLLTHRSHYPSLLISWYHTMSLTSTASSQMFDQACCKKISSSFYRSFPSTIKALNKMEVSAQLIVWRSFPKGWGLRPTHITPGQYLLRHFIMDSSNTLTHDGLNSSPMFLFHNSSHCLMRWNPSSYSLAWSVCWSEEIICSKRFLIM